MLRRDPSGLGDRYGVWSGQLVSRSFPIANGVLILSSNDMALAMASAEKSKNPVFGCVGDSKESVIRRTGEPNYWGQVEYTNTSAAVFYNDDYTCSFRFFTSTNGQTILGEVSFQLTNVDESLKDGVIQKILQANSSGQEWVKSEKSNKLSERYKREGAKASVSYHNIVVIALDEYSTLIANMDKEKAKEQSNRLGKGTSSNSEDGSRTTLRALIPIPPPPLP